MADGGVATESSLLRVINEKYGGLGQQQIRSMREQGLDPTEPKEREAYLKQELFHGQGGSSQSSEMPTKFPYTTEPIKYGASSDEESQ